LRSEITYSAFKIQDFKIFQIYRFLLHLKIQDLKVPRFQDFKTEEAKRVPPSASTTPPTSLDDGRDGRAELEGLTNANNAIRTSPICKTVPANAASSCGLHYFGAADSKPFAPTVTERSHAWHS
jgi:hypothetical protein